MIFKELSMSDAEIIFNSYLANGIPDNIGSKLDSTYSKLRTDILEMAGSNVEKSYEFDLNFALKLFEYFSKLEDFSEVVASNYGFWRYVCLNVVPDLIEKRKGLNSEYFYSKNVRLYIPSMWWFIEISYQGNIQSTRKLLENLNTDYILQFVERPGRDGTYVNVMRLIFKYICSLPKSVTNVKVGNANLMRRVLMQHTACNPNYNLIFEDKTDEYVRLLFKNCGVNISDYE